MNSLDVLVDAFGRVSSDVHRALGGPGSDTLGPDELALRVDGTANPVSWLVWHLTRVQDDHLADLAGAEQTWTADGWSSRFGLPFADGDIGYGHSSEQVDTVARTVVDPALLLGYLDATQERTVAYLRTLTDADLDAVIDDAWDPPVTRGVRIISVVDDDIQHAGQAAYTAGIARGRRARR